jgi:polysaccharide chain length determinant protein (PEP-CTERM system associated)
MQELMNQVLAEVRGIWRFRWQGQAIAWVVCLVGWAAVFSIPNQYEARARVYVDTRTALRPIVQGLAIEPDVEAQLNMVRQALLGRPNLEKVARETDLDVQAKTRSEREALLAGLAQRVEIALEPPATRDPRVPNTLYRITYKDSSRDKAMQVVNVLLTSFMEDTMGSGRFGAENAQKFLDQQIKEYEDRLGAAENRLAEFKKRNLGLVPGAEGGYFVRLQTEMTEVQRLESNLSVATSRRRELERQKRGETPFVAGAISAARPANSGGPSDAVDTTTRIQQTQTRLDELLLRFTDKHPDVVAARESLNELQNRREQEIAALRRGDPGAVATAGAATNPLYQSIQLAINQTDVEIAALQGDIANRRTTINQLRQLVNTAPEVEAEFARLNRDYDVTKAQYNQLAERRERARLSDDAQATGLVRFDVIDPTVASFTPVSPPRSLFVLAVGIAGFALGAGFAFLRHRLQPVFGDTRTLEAITQLPVLGMVSLTWPEKHRAERRMGNFRYAAALTLLVAATFGALVLNGPGSRLVQRILS